MKFRLSVLAVLLALGALAGVRAVTPDPYGGNPNAWQMKRHRDKMGIVTNGGARVVFIGDSITHLWEYGGKKTWDKFFANGEMKALNLGISGDRTEHVLWRITEGGELDGYEAKCILVMIGTNNSGHFPFDQETPIDTIFGIRAILKAIAEKQPKARVILTSIFPVGQNPSHKNRRRNNVVNKEISALADGKRVIWCDFSDKFLDAQGRLSPEIFPDYLHPNALGYEIWASSVIPLIKQCLVAKDDECIPSVWPSSPTLYDYEECAAKRPTSAFGAIEWWDKSVVLNQRQAIVDNGGKQFDIVWVGDSITHRWYREGGEGVKLWAELKKQYNMLNLGIGGDQTQHVLWRLKNGELSGYKAKMFAVMIGTNNNCGNANNVAGGIRLIVDEIRAKHPESKIVLMPIFPRSAKVTDKARKERDAINAIIKGYADGQDVRWLDFNAAFLTADGTLTKDVMNDLLHPNEKGYDIWWKAIGPVVREICGK